jgi:DNA-binding response OmpR family regulator
VQSSGDILIVEDEDALATLLTIMLTEQGYAVRLAANGEQALASIAEAAPALLLLDVMMPGMSGLEVVARLREAKQDTMPILLLTAVPHVASPLLTQGDIICLRKPIPFDQLLAVINMYMQPLRSRERS